MMRHPFRRHRWIGERHIYRTPAQRFSIVLSCEIDAAVDALTDLMIKAWRLGGRK